MFLVNSNSYSTSLGDDLLYRLETLVVLLEYPLLLLVSVLFALNWCNNKYFWLF